MRKPPPKGEFWRAFAAVTILPISGTDKAVLGCLVDFANSETGACWPGQNTIARATGKDIRAVKRSIQNLIKTPYLKRTQRYRASNPSDLMSTQRHHTSNLYEIGWDALLQAFDAYKQRRSRNARNGYAVTPVTGERGGDKNVTLGGDKNVTAGVTKTSPNKEEVDKEKEKRNTLKASPLRGDAESDASLVPPAGEVNNVGGMLARFERKFKQNPNSIPDLEEWQNWLKQLHEEGDFDDPNAQRAGRLADDVDYYLDDAA
jgi:Helix-turn-helix domain